VVNVRVALQDASPASFDARTRHWYVVEYANPDTAKLVADVDSFTTVVVNPSVDTCTV